MLTRMKLALSHLQHKFRQSFQDTLNPLCYGSMRAKTITHYFLRCHFYTTTFFTTISNNNLISFLLFGDDKLNDTLLTHRDLMRSFSDKLPECYTCETTSICRFVEGFFNFSRGQFYTLFYIFFDCNVNFYFSQ